MNNIRLSEQAERLAFHLDEICEKSKRLGSPLKSYGETVALYLFQNFLRHSMHAIIELAGHQVLIVKERRIYFNQNILDNILGRENA